MKDIIAIIVYGLVMFILGYISSSKEKIKVYQTGYFEGQLNVIENNLPNQDTWMKDSTYFVNNQ